MSANNNATMQKRLITEMKKKTQKPPKPKPSLPQQAGGGVGALDHLVQRRVLSGGGGGGGTMNYNDLQNIPSINGAQLRGTLTLQDIGITQISAAEIEEMFNEIIGGL